MHFATSMAFSRQQWVEKYRNRLEGALGEYTKLLIIRHFKLPDSGWENEVKALLKKVELKGSKANCTPAAMIYSERHMKCLRCSNDRGVKISNHPTILPRFPGKRIAQIVSLFRVILNTKAGPLRKCSSLLLISAMSSHVRPISFAILTAMSSKPSLFLVFSHSLLSASQNFF